MADIFSPFSSSALGTLPNLPRPQRYTRADAIPDVEGNEDGDRPTVRDYHSISSAPSQVRVPKKIATPVKVEGKVWFANERTWVAWLNLSILLGTLSLALFNASKDYVARSFAYTYAVISIGVLIYGYLLYQKRITMIQRRDPGHFGAYKLPGPQTTPNHLCEDEIVGPVIISALLFVAILSNFIIRGKF
ncbi:hypothetical protein PM082_016448 [Marasmius tenuissimus]|nr:hypothetical protein PM082_016448 [Marasmius tenuissimus]